jgi:hypothetical protein
VGIIAKFSSYMHQLIIVTFFSRFLLLILLTGSINGQLGTAHAEQTSVSPAKTGESFAMVSARPEKKTVHEHHNHTGECHTCCNCFCNVILSIQSIKLDYNPVIMSFGSFKPIANLPEVTLSRFIPPRAVA